MSHCLECGADLQETESFSYTYEGEIFEFCSGSCMEDHSIIDRHGTRFPRSVEHFTAFNGDSDRAGFGSRVYIGTPSDDTFYCDDCDNDFYGDGVYMEDTGNVFCRRCANENHYNDDSTWYEHEQPWDTDDEPPPRSRRAPTDATGCTNDGFSTFPGEATERFLGDVLVGIEFEHAPVKNSPECTARHLFTEIDDKPANYGRFVCHGDGSIATMGGYVSSEIVSMPASGDQLERTIDAFYEPFKSGTFAPGPEHPTCGFHMHVGSRFLDKIRKMDSKSDIARDTKTRAVEALKAMSTICMEFISSSRRANHFCNEPPAMRDKNMGKNGSLLLSYVYGMGGYPALAVRSIATFEFRMWPSSNSVRYTKARAELSQRLIDHYDRCFMVSDAISMDEDAVKSLISVAELCRGGERTKLVDRLVNMLGLSAKATEALREMHAKFNPYSFGKTMFKFTPTQVNAMKAESSVNSTDYVTIRDLVADGVGDTLIDCRMSGSDEKELYISLDEGIKCYPAAHSGPMAEAVARLAGGEV